MRSISERFIESLSDDFSITKTKNIFNKSVTGILLASVTSGAFANTGHSMEDLTETINPIVTAQNQELQTNYSVDTSRLMITQDTLAEFEKEGVHGTVIDNPEFLYEITPDNYEHIIKNGISGVYANPALEGEITVIYFENDQRDNPHNLIRHQFQELGNSSFGYENDYRLLQLNDIASNALTGHGRSVHSFTSSEGYETDANTTLITERGDPNSSSYNIEVMSTILHESAHGYENTKWAKGTVFDLITDFKALESDEEISARTGDRILIQQFAKETGNLDNLDYFRSNDTAPHLLSNPQNTDGHLNYFVDNTFSDVMKTNSEMVYNMDKQQIYDYSTEMVKQSNNYDFTDDLKDKVSDILGGMKLDKMIESFESYTYQDRVKFFDDAHNFYEKELDSMEDKGFRTVHSQKFENYVGFLVTKEIVGDFLEDAKVHPYGSFKSGDDILKNKDDIVNAVVNRLNDSGEPIVITNFDNNHLTAYAGTSGFIENFKETDTFQNILSQTSEYSMNEKEYNENGYSSYYVHHEDKSAPEQVNTDIQKPKRHDYSGLTM